MGVPRACAYDRGGPAQRAEGVVQGAMRIWGRHATAFVGKRHFDDPDLFEKYFRPVE